MKTCIDKDCKQQNPQPLSNFTMRSQSKDGKDSRCRECANRRLRERRRGIRNPKLFIKIIVGSDGISRKMCSRCKDLVPVDLFTKDSSARTGLSSSCRICSGVTLRKRVTKLPQGKCQYYHIFRKNAFTGESLLMGYLRQGDEDMYFYLDQDKDYWTKTPRLWTMDDGTKKPYYDRMKVAINNDMEYMEVKV